MEQNNQHSECKECENRYPSDKFQLCPVCNSKLMPISDNPQINQESKGNAGQTIQVGGDNSGSIIIHPPTEKNEPEEDDITRIYRSFIKPLSVGKNAIKSWWFYVITALSVIGSIASIIGTLKSLSPNSFSAGTSHLLVPALFAACLFMVPASLTIAIMLKRSRYVKIPFLSQTIEKDNYGYLYRTKVAGTCGLCKSPTHLVKRGPENHKETLVVCNKNPDQHFWSFDPTVLRDVGEDYRENFKNDQE